MSPKFIRYRVALNIEILIRGGFKMKNVEAELKKIIGSLIGMESDSESITEETNLLKDLGFDSILLVQLIAEIEDEFQIVFKDSDMDVDKLYKFSELTSTVKKYIAK